MICILNDLNWTILLFVSLFSLVCTFSIGYFKLGKSYKIQDFFNLSVSRRIFEIRLSRYCKITTVDQFKLIDTNNKNNLTPFYKMTSFERKQSFIKRSLDERKNRQNQTNQHESSFTYSSIFSFTKTLINRAPKSLTTNSVKKKNQPETELANSSNSLMISKPKLPTGTMSTMNTMSALNETHNEQSKITGLSKSVSLQIKDEIKAIPKNKLLHQSSSGSSNSSTPADLFLMGTDKATNFKANFKHKPLINNHKVYQQPTYTELVTQIQSHEDAINREYLLHQLNPSQYHSMHYYRRLERQNGLNKKLSSSHKKITKQDTVQSNSSNPENNSNELEHTFTSSSSNLSCSECGSLDTEEELTLPFMKKAGHYQPSLRSKQPLKLSSSLDKSHHLSNSMTKQCSSDSNNEAMVGLLNENLIKRQLSNGTYLKLSDRLTDKRKRILGRRLTAQNSFSAGSSFNNSSNNSSFDHDDMLVQFTSHQANSFSSTDQHFHYYHYENNSIHSNDTSSSSNSSCGNRHAERTKTLNLNEFNNLNLCDNRIDEPNEQEYNLCPNNVLQVNHAYDPTSKKLKIRILKINYVPIKLNQDCDRCYLKLILLPNKRQKFKTTIKSCTSNEIEFDELFTFNRISPESIMSLSIQYLLFIVNKESKRRNIGEAIIRFDCRKPMQQEDNLIVYLNPLNMQKNSNSSTNLQCNFNVIPNQSNDKSNTANNESLSDVSSICRSDSAESHHSIKLNLPELLIGLAYNATTGRLQVSIIRGSQFKDKANRPPDTFVKCTLLSSAGREIGKTKTTVKKSQPNPVYKQTFAFQIALFQLPDVSLMVTVYNKRTMNRKEIIGWFSLGCNSSGEEENSHWNEMRDSKGEQVLKYHFYYFLICSILYQ